MSIKATMEGAETRMGGGGFYIPSNLEWRIRSLANMSKTKIQITPTTPSTIGPNQKIQITLPYSSLLDLSTFTLEFEGETTNGINPSDARDTKISTLRFPRNTYSLIQEIQIKFNNVVVQHLTDYNMIQNILFDIVSNNQDADGRMACCCLNNDPSSKVLVNNNGETLSFYDSYDELTTAKYDLDSDVATDRSVYFIKSFLGILQQGNVNVIDTSMVGQIQITITFASAAVLGASRRPVAAVDSEGDPIEYNWPHPTYKLRDIKANCTKINMPPWYYEALKNNLMQGNSYDLYFPHYSTFFGQASKYKSQTTRFTIASDSLDYLIGTFISADKDDVSDVKPMALLPAIQSDGTRNITTGAPLSTMIDLGSTAITFNQSMYFVRNGSDLISSQWTVGSEKLPQVPSTLANCVQNVVEGFNLHQSADLGFYHGCTNMYMFKNFFFADMLSLEHVGDTTGTMLVSGLNTRQLPVSLEWHTRASTTAKGDSDPTYLPMVIAKECRRVSISAGNQISIA